MYSRVPNSMLYCTRGRFRIFGSGYGDIARTNDEYLVVEEVVTVTDWELLGITEIYSATNAVSAVRILNEKKIDIMICDIEMPQTDGLELSKKAKENFPDLEIVMLTSHAEFNYVRNALRYGCYDYLLKPVMEDDIIKVMKNLVTKIERERHQALIIFISHDRFKQIIITSVSQGIYEH